jgi:hypothetical protein
VTAPIIGAIKTYHLKQIFEAADIKLNTEEVDAPGKPNRPHPILGHEQPRGKDAQVDYNRINQSCCMN